MEDKDLREVAKKNVLAIDEVCDLVNLSRQHIYNLVKSGKLEPLKQTKRGQLFWKPDVLECDFWRKVSKNQIGVVEEIGVVKEPEPMKPFTLPSQKPLKTIQELRKQTGLKQTDFAEKFHLSVKTLQRWEQNQTETPEQVLFMISRILELESLLYS